MGSNIERDYYIRAGLKSLQQHFGQLELSSIYEAKAIGFDGDAFYNLVAGFNSELDAVEIAALLREIEYQHGRGSNSQKFSSRTLDLDLLLVGELIINSPQLQLPRPDIVRYGFVLQPLAEIAPQLIHPLIKQSYSQLWQQFDKHALMQHIINPAWLIDFINHP
jgi:2-amino-4-hydroxy-6-hydroxymethyldihydropteridine diphosphokinase